MNNNYQEVAKIALHKASRVLKFYFNKSITIKTKSAHFDQVTEADIESEKVIVQVIKKFFPRHNILAEENQYQGTDSEYTWIIDPLDGTNNFTHALPVFSISIALAQKQKVIMGLVYNPIRDELFTAQAGKGAFLNEKAIRVSENIKLKQSLLITGFYYDRSEHMKRTLKNIELFFEQGIMGIRRFGSAALDLAFIACGRADGFWEFCLNPWDFAAGKLILEEAGGKVTDLEGKSIAIKPSYIVASNGQIHRAMRRVLNTADA